LDVRFRADRTRDSARSNFQYSVTRSVSIRLGPRVVAIEVATGTQRTIGGASSWFLPLSVVLCISGSRSRPCPLNRGTRPMIDWSIEAVSFGRCNCDYGCPCQFERRPSQGNCRGFEVGRIERGHFGGVTLDGLCYALLYAWPGAIYEGNGTMQVIIDERADEKQRKALATVLCGGETEAGMTHWWVYRAMSTTVHEPIVKPIDFEV